MPSAGLSATISRCLRKEPVSERDAISVFVNFGATIADYVAVGALPDAKALALCAEHEGIEHLQAATSSGEGVILATGHFSFFEFGAVVLGRMGKKVTIATLPEPSDDLTAWRAAWRRRWGTETIAVGTDPFSSLQVARAIEEGHCMAMLADRPIAERGVSFDLPNGRTMLSSSPALLSWMTGCKILPVIVTRLSNGRYRITAKPAVEARRVPHKERDAEIARCTRDLGTSLFEEIQSRATAMVSICPGRTMRQLLLLLLAVSILRCAGTSAEGSGGVPCAPVGKPKRFGHAGEFPGGAPARFDGKARRRNRNCFVPSSR